MNEYESVEFVINIINSFRDNNLTIYYVDGCIKSDDFDFANMRDAANFIEGYEYALNKESN